MLHCFMPYTNCTPLHTPGSPCRVKPRSADVSRPGCNARRMAGTGKRKWRWQLHRSVHEPAACGRAGFLFCVLATCALVRCVGGLLAFNLCATCRCLYPVQAHLWSQTVPELGGLDKLLAVRTPSFALLEKATCRVRTACSCKGSPHPFPQPLYLLPGHTAASCFV